MRKIREFLKYHDYERGNALPIARFTFKNVWAIGLFCADDTFCGQYQRDLRSLKSGCKWRCTECAFRNGLRYLHFVQKMGF